MIVVRAESQLDEGARIGHGLALPTVIRLELAKGGFGRSIPFAAGQPAHVVLTDERFLDLMGALSIDLLLTSPVALLAAFGLARTGGH